MRKKRVIRRAILTLVISTVLWTCSTVERIFPAEAAEKFTFQQVIDRARDLAQSSYEEEGRSLPQELRDISYDRWRDIRFRPGRSLWREEKLPFEVQFFHLGLFYNRPVRINVVTVDGIEPVPFAAELFDYGKNQFEKKFPADLGFAGFRLHYPINRPDYRDEVAVFLGASYFRALGRDQKYGLSARGLAIDTGLPTGEEFPWFREFWLEKPAPEADFIVLHALLDSPSISGAYSFTIRPGTETLIDVKCVLFPRREIRKLGIAPLTSMFFYGENDNIRPADDFRPEIHDSDGLSILSSTGEWLWRPLRNPEKLSVPSFVLEEMSGFGLVQRDLNFDHYQDLEARYDNRPSIWIAPGEKWGRGHIELIEIPTDSEYNDNIVAFWVPEVPPRADESLELSYRMSWKFPRGSQHVGRVVSTRTGSDAEDGSRKFIVDFAGGDLNALPADAGLASVITLSEGTELLEKQLQKNPVTGGWRLVLRVASPRERAISPRRKPLEIRAYLKRGENAVDALTETWIYEF